MKQIFKSTIENINFIFLKSKRILNICSPYLHEGKYHLDYSRTYLYCDLNIGEGILKNTFLQYSRKDCRKIDLLKKSLYRLISHKVTSSRDNQVKGVLVLITSSEKEYKVFDFNSEQIATVFIDEYRYLSRKRSILYFNKYFILPQITHMDDNNYVIIEQYLKSDNDKDTLKTFQHILKVYEDYFNKIYPKYLDFFDLEYTTNDQFVQKIKTYIQDRCNVLCLPQILCHGDLWSSNILFSNQQYYFIDWEHSKTNYFLYDIFMFMFSEEFIKHDSRLLNSYFCGELDNAFSDLFNAFNLAYDKTMKDCYFLVFVLGLYIDRWKDKENQDILNRLILLLEKYLICFD